MLYNNKILSMNLATDLNELQSCGKSVRVCVVGSGQMGTDLVTAIRQMNGMKLASLVARRLISAPKVMEIAGYSAQDWSVCDSDRMITHSTEAGKIPVVEDPNLALSHEMVDVVIDATGSPDAGAELGMASLKAGKHLVMMNVEADVTVGAILQKEAERKGVVYTVGAGDEPTATMELYDFITALGHPVVAAGKGKNNQLNIDAIPDDYREEAERRNMNSRMLVEFVDGSKTMFEMSCLANATGLVPDVPGMHGPDCSLENLHNILCPVEDGGILSQNGCVDFTVGKGVAPGVFVIADIRSCRLRERLNDLHLGKGPYYTFYRPFHLTSLEVPLSAARAFLYGHSDMKSLDRPVSEVCALAKRDLRAGEQLDAIGETCYRSWIMKASEARKEKAIPVSLLHEGTVTKNISKGALLTKNNVTILRKTSLFKLREEQDKWLGYSRF
ncbi:NAD(P)H-dependent oxidoreductase [Candidatus Endowatersipora endosymbiont of Watersipora subatra]|uniref:NAD(P)H-dependent oxidoreductase n=1 Tax=Candidatus Endowatersipora endosymbiont of Watersipora subatra TaxID=3077946 RepID=UPI003C7A9AAE